MKIPSTRKSLLIVIFILLIIDVIILFFFVSKNKPPRSDFRDHKQNGIHVILEEEVRFTPAQMAQFEELRKVQQAELKPLFGNIRRSKDSLYAMLYNEELPDTLKKERADSIGFHQTQLDLHMFDYFKDIRKICTEEQLPKFDSSIKKIVLRMTGKRGKTRADSEKHSNSDK